MTRRTAPAPRLAVVRMLYAPDDDVPLDRAMVLWMPGPATSTGEDVVELHLHGGPAVVASVERTLAAMPGLEAAAPGAFTRRAFENGVVDLTQVEGLAALTTAETEVQRRIAVTLAEGGLRHEVERWQAAVLGLSARVEALIDFVEEGDVAADETLGQDIAVTLAAMTEPLSRPPAERLRAGVAIGFAGPPNAGKSSLVNALARREAALVSPVAGTTRDLIEVPLSLGGIPVVLVDMAGLRENTADAIEAMGSARARTALERMDIVVWLGDARSAPAHPHVLFVASKSDIEAADPRADCVVSATTGAGLPDLVDLLASMAAALLPTVARPGLGAFQRAALGDATAALQRASLVDDMVLRAEELRLALGALDRITGRAGIEDMLDALFAGFCLGK